MGRPNLDLNLDEYLSTRACTASMSPPKLDPRSSSGALGLPNEPSKTGAAALNPSSPMASSYTTTTHPPPTSTKNTAKNTEQMGNSQDQYRQGTLGFGDRGEAGARAGKGSRGKEEEEEEEEGRGSMAEKTERSRRYVDSRDSEGADQGGLDAARAAEEKKKKINKKEEGGSGGGSGGGKEKVGGQGEVSGGQVFDTEDEGKKALIDRTNNKEAPEPGGKGGPMGLPEGRKEDRLKGKL